MRRFRLLLAIALLASAALAPGAGRAATTSSNATLTGFTCQRAVDPAFRAMNVTAIMHPVAGTQAMRLQFILLESHALHGHYDVVHGHNLGVWIAPNDPTLGQRASDTWKLTHPVALLSAPAFYRLKVTFRWLGAGGKRLAQVTQQTSVCHQLELRPDLRVANISARSLPNKPANDKYVVTIANRGLTGARTFDVDFTPQGGATVIRLVPKIGRRGHHGILRIQFVATACTAPETITVVVDPAGAIPDLDRSNNTLTWACPAATTG
jgi:hypothetical protein